MNILILSCGTRNKIVQYFKKNLNGRGLVFCTDCTEFAPALYEADKFFIVPKINENGYLERILSICKENNIDAVLSLIDPELSILSKNRQIFLDIGTLPIISDIDAIEVAFDKFKMYEYLIEKGINTVRSYIDKEKFYEDVDSGVIDYPVFVKPVKGSASLNINKVTSKEEVELLFYNYSDLMIQEYMDGIEYGADVYIDLISEEPVSIFVKKKVKMRSGETDKSISIKEKELFNLIQYFVKKSKFKGIIDIDIFLVNGDYYISEVNPRFGGGYPHAYESGVNFPEMIINNVNGKANENQIGNYKQGTKMMKYNDIIYLD